MTSRMRQQQSDGFLTIRNAWMEGKTLTPGDPVSIFETNINNLLGADQPGKARGQHVLLLSYSLLQSSLRAQ